jgi:predicted PurR-regulated permease PerM
LNDLKDYSLKVLVTILIIGVIALLVYIFAFVKDIILITFLSIIISLFIRNIAKIIESRLKLKRWFSFTLAIIALILVLFLPFVSIYMPFAAQAQNLIKNLPNIIGGFEDFLKNLTSIFPSLTNALKIEDITQTTITTIQNLIGNTLGYIATASGWIVNFFIMIILAIFFALSPAEYRDMFLDLFPEKNRNTITITIREIEEVLKNWINGMLLAIFFVGAVTTLGFWIIRLDYFLVFGIAAGFLEIIPYFGPFLGCIAPAIYVLIQSPSKIIPIIIIYLIIQFLENNFFLPFIMRKQVKLPPAVTIIVILAMGKLLGFLGIIVAVPLFAIILLLFNKFTSGRKVYLSDSNIPN